MLLKELIKIYSLNLAADSRILSVCVCLEGQAYENIVDTLPDGDVSDYKYINNEYVYDPLPTPEPPQPEPPSGDYATYDELAAAIREGVNSYGQ